MNAQDTTSALPEPRPETPVACSPALTQALQRLRSSRRRLHEHWVPADPAGASGSSRRSRGRGGLAGLWRRWRRRLERLPGAEVVVPVLASWWQSHPWRVTGELMADHLLPRAAAMVRRRPWLSLGIAAALGYATVSLRPWRSDWCRGQAARLPRRIGRTLRHLAGQVPLHTMLAGMLAGSTIAAGTRPPETAAEAGQGPRSPATEVA